MKNKGKKSRFERFYVFLCCKTSTSGREGNSNFLCQLSLAADRFAMASNALVKVDVHLSGRERESSELLLISQKIHKYDDDMIENWKCINFFYHFFLLRSAACFWISAIYKFNKQTEHAEWSRREAKGREQTHCHGTDREFIVRYEANLLLCLSLLSTDPQLKLWPKS